MQTRTRLVFAVALLIASLLPYAAFIAAGWSPFVMFWEFACYRYFGAMSYFESTTLPFWIVQGMPMALMQTIIMLPLLAFDSAQIGTPEQIELFSHISLLLAYVLIGATLAVCALSRRLLMLDAAALGLAVLALFPTTRWYPYFLWATVASLLLGGVLIGHTLVIRSRPSGTSVVDLAIYGVCLAPLGLAISGTLYRGYVAAAALVVAVILVPPVSLLPPRQHPSSMIAHVTEAATFVRSLNRPVLVVFHDNRAHPLTMEALALYTGQLPPIVSGSRSLRERFLGGTRILSDPRDPRDLVTAIQRGDVIMWGSAPGAPAVETYFPDLRLLTENKRAVLRTFEIERGGHTAHIGYLPAPCFAIMSAAESSLDHDCPRDTTMSLGADRQP